MTIYDSMQNSLLEEKQNGKGQIRFLYSILLKQNGRPKKLQSCHWNRRHWNILNFLQQLLQCHSMISILPHRFHKGRCEIRTRGRPKAFFGFQDRPLQPLRQPSTSPLGLEPRTFRLTAERSAIELWRNSNAPNWT